jgi:hypothetical protein
MAQEEDEQAQAQETAQKNKTSEKKQVSERSWSSLLDLNIYH